LNFSKGICLFFPNKSGDAWWARVGAAADQKTGSLAKGGLLRFGFHPQTGFVFKGSSGLGDIICDRVTSSGQALPIKGGAGRRPLQSTKTVSYRVRPAVFPSRRVSSVALVPPVVVVSLVVAVLAVLRVVAVSRVLAMRWFSFVHEGFSPAMEPNGLRRFWTPGFGEIERNRAANMGSGKGAIAGSNVETAGIRPGIADDSAPLHDITLGN
jgi:hypothetical protein